MLLFKLVCLLQLVVLLMALQSRYAKINIINRSSSALLVEQATLKSGKWFQCGGPAINDELRSPLKSPDQVIEPNKKGKVCACGRYWSWSGTEGKFKIMEKSSSDEHADVELFEVHFKVPFGTSKNVLNVTATNKTARSRLFGYECFAGDLEESRKLPDAGILIFNRD